jgi:hypothetical protein
LPCTGSGEVHQHDSGPLDEIAIYNFGLSSTKVTEHYNPGK